MSVCPCCANQMSSALLNLRSRSDSSAVGRSKYRIDRPIVPCRGHAGRSGLKGGARQWRRHCPNKELPPPVSRTTGPGSTRICHYRWQRFAGRASSAWAGVKPDPRIFPSRWRIASPLPGSTQPRPACRGDDVMACIAGEESGHSLWLLRCTPSDNKPGRLSRCGARLAGEKRQASTAGSVNGRSRSAATCSESNAPSCVDRPLASAGSAAGGLPALVGQLQHVRHGGVGQRVGRRAGTAPGMLATQ